MTQLTQQLGPVCVDIAGFTLTDEERARLRHPLTGMVILFTRNYENREQLTALCADIHATRPGILISVDHEGGRVQRFREAFTAVPAMRDLADREDANEAYEAAGIVLAAELRACGVDFTFAPVLDVDYGRSGVIGNRSLGCTPLEVTTHAEHLIRGLRRGGMASCGKHFPGHGWAEADSHTALPEDERAYEAVAADMAPYGALHELASIMTAHVAYDAFQGEIATFSAALLKGELRDRLGFKGLVFSDDLSMKGAAGGSITTQAERALASGCDMVLVCNHPELCDELLANLQWTRPESFDQRFEGLRPSDMPSDDVQAHAREVLCLCVA